MKKKVFTNGYLFLVLLFSNSLHPTFKFSNNNSALGLDRTNSAFTLNTSITGVNGTIKLRTTSVATNITNATGAETITFSQGSSIEQGSGSVNLSGGMFNPGSEILTLSGTEVLVGSSSATIYPDVVIASGATASIVGNPTFNSPVTLADSTTSLNLGVQNTLDQNIQLNGGTVTLLEDLTLAENTKISGPGTVDANFQSLTLNSGAWKGDLTFWRAQDIQLNGPVSLTGAWSFLTNSTDNQSTINGNGNTLTLTNGQIIVGDSSAGHTLYLSDLNIKGISSLSSAYTAPGITKSQYAGLAGLAGATITAGNTAYDAGFKVLATSTSSLVNMYSIAVYDDPTFSTSFITGVNKSNNAYQTTLITGPTATFFGSVSTSLMTDIAPDGSYVWIDGLQPIIQLFNGSSVSYVRWGGQPSPSLVAIGSVADNNIYCVGQGSYWLTAENGDFTRVSKYLGTPGGNGAAFFDTPNTWNNTWATGYTNIAAITASTDGYVWVLDNQSGTYHLYKTNGGPMSGATEITLPEQPLSTVVSSMYNQPISIKGSSSNLVGAYLGASGTVYVTTDGLTFTSLGSFEARSVAAGAYGTIAFVGPSDSALPGFSNGNAVFVKAPTSVNAFNLYDGGATDANRGKVICSNVTFDMGGNYTHSAGRITFTDSNSTIVTGGNKTFSIASANGPVQVDGAALIYEPLSGTNTSPFLGSPQAPTLLNGGMVRSALVIPPSGVYLNTAVDANANNGMIFGGGPLTQNYTLIGSNSNQTGQFTVTNTTNAPNQTVIIDGGNHFWQFPGIGTTPVFSIADNVVVTLQNVVLKDFSLNNVSFGGANAGLLFGDGCVIELSSNQSLDVGQAGYTFAGDATIRGGDQMLTLTATDSITQTGIGKTLTFENVILNSQAINSFACTTPTARVVLYNCNLQIDQNGFTFATGSLVAAGYTKIYSTRGDTSNAVAQFQFTSAGSLIINRASTLEIGRSIYFTYNPNTTNDVGGATGSAAKRHFYTGSSFDNSPVLYCNNCTIDSTNAPMAFDYGNLIVSNQVTFSAPTASGIYSELANTFLIEMLAGSVLRLEGSFVYTNL